MAAQPAGAGRGKCPICGRPSKAAYKPFCSRRCADVDLARWLGGVYAIPDKVESEDGREQAVGERSDPADPTPKGTNEKE
jgi:endogenous inhibitor of DNA gyrase (YacG/DUF329 family)